MKSAPAPKRPKDLDEDFEIHTNSKGEAIRFPFQDAMTFDIHRVWTVVEGDGGCEHDNGEDEDGELRGPCDCLEHEWYALPGFHIVNVLHYVITDNPWKDGIDYPDYIAP